MSVYVGRELANYSADRTGQANVRETVPGCSWSMESCILTGSRLDRESHWQLYVLGKRDQCVLSPSTVTVGSILSKPSTEDCMLQPIECVLCSSVPVPKVTGCSLARSLNGQRDRLTAMRRRSIWWAQRGVIWSARLMETDARRLIITLCAYSQTVSTACH